MKEFINDYYRLFCSKYAEDICRFVNGYDFTKTGGEFDGFYKYSESSAHMANPYWRNSAKFTISEIWTAIQDLFYVMDFDFKDVFQKIIRSLCDGEATEEVASLAMVKCESIFKYVVYKYFCLPENEKDGKLTLGTVSYALSDFLRQHSNGYHFYWSIAVLTNARNLACHEETPKPIDDSDDFRLRILRYIISVVVGIVAILNKYKQDRKRFDPICEPLKVKIMTVASEDITVTEVAWGQDESDKMSIGKIEGAEIREFEIKIQRHKPIFFDIKYVHNGETKTASYSPSLDFNDNADYALEICIPEAKYNCRFKKIDIAIPKDGKYKEIADSQVVSNEVSVNDGKQITEEKTAKQPEPDVPVILEITADLECGMTLPGVVQDYPVACNENVKFKIPKGRHEITLTSKANPSYTMTREVEVTGDTVIKDMLFAEEVRNHREWWDAKDIVVLKKTLLTKLTSDRRIVDHVLVYVLWDKSVNLPVYEATTYGEHDVYKSLSIIGNFVHIYNEERGSGLLYSCVAHSDEPLEGYTFQKAFAIKNKWYALVRKHPDNYCIIDDTGAEIFQLPEIRSESDASLVKNFAFSEGYAAMLRPDKTISFLTEDWIRERNVYCYGKDDAYPVFRDGFCAVRKADEGCLFLEIKDGEICERSERYDRLVPKQGDGGWAYEAEKDGRRSLIVPEKDGGLKEILSYDSMENLSNGFRVITLTTDEGVRKVILNAEGKVIATDFVGYELIDPCGVKVTYADKTTCVYDAGGNCYIRGLWEDYTMFPLGLLRVKMNGSREVWRCKDGSWSKIADSKHHVRLGYGILLFYDSENRLVSVMNKDGDKLIKYAGNWVWEKDEGKTVPGTPVAYISKCVHTLVTFANIVSPERIGLMRRDTLEEVVTPGYEKIERVGNLWVAYNAQGKTFFSDLGEQLKVALEIDSVQEFTSDLNIVCTEGGYCLMDAYGNIKTKSYSEIRNVVNGYAAFKDEYDDWGFLRISGDNAEVACSTAYYQVKDFTPEGYAMVQQRQYGGWGLIDSEGNLVVDCCYDHIDPFKCDYTSARVNLFGWHIVKKKGC